MRNILRQRATHTTDVSWWNVRMKNQVVNWDRDNDMSMSAGLGRIRAHWEHLCQLRLSGPAGRPRLVPA